MAQTIAALDIPSLETELADQSPQKILERSLSLFDNIAISFSGAEDVVLIDMAHRLRASQRAQLAEAGNAPLPAFALPVARRRAFLLHQPGAAGRAPELPVLVTAIVDKLGVLGI